jgi:O-antigen ligase
VVVFYFFGLQVFKKIDRIDKFNWSYILGTSVLIIYTLVRHSKGYFSHEYSYKAALPFFSDHNIYAVVIAFFVPTTIIYALKTKVLGQSTVRGMLFWVLAGLFAVGVIASYTRAAWVSLAVALLMYFLLLLKIKLRTLLCSAVLLGGGLALTWNDIVLYMSKNKVESDSKLDAHVKSIYNVTTDDSNTERINRWSAALRMFMEKPVFGFGPNTYQFQYGPYQLSRQKTKISTNLGLLGNAHSEYIGPLAEQGLLGGLLVIALMLAVVHRAMQLYYTDTNPRVKYLALMVLLSMVSYYAHGLLNNYLDVDKANVLFWASIAVITALDVYHRQDAGTTAADPTAGETLNSPE